MHGDVELGLADSVRGSVAAEGGRWRPHAIGGGTSSPAYGITDLRCTMGCGERTGECGLTLRTQQVGSWQRPVARGDGNDSEADRLGGDVMASVHMGATNGERGRHSYQGLSYLRSGP